MSNKPFIISTKFTSQPVVPTDSDVYNPDQETRVQILQAINGYISVNHIFTPQQINMFIESCKLFWSFWHFQIQCPTFSYLSLGFLGINLIWSICSYIGFRAIRSKNSRQSSPNQETCGYLFSLWWGTQYFGSQCISSVGR